ncbi:hypothetical protein EI94DRAFT_1740851 [Lactarius quietus]|nr:hypothetical protein EI94DRAFT_1740851 [Lactarius quietus]
MVSVCLSFLSRNRPDTDKRQVSETARGLTHCVISYLVGFKCFGFAVVWRFVHIFV